MSKKILTLFIMAFLFVSLIVSSTSAASVNLSLSSDTVSSGDTVTASGTADANTWVAIKIVDSSQNIVLFDAIKSDVDGAYTYTFKLPENATGTLNVVVGYGSDVAVCNLSCSNRIIDVGLVISGTAIGQPMYLTKEELKSIAAGQHATIQSEFKHYSTMARGGVKTMISALGIDLGDLLQLVGIGTDSYTISTISADKNRVDLKYNGTSQCFEPQQYYYADMLPGNNGTSGPVDPILALYRAFSTEEDFHPHLPTRQELTEVEQFPLPTLTIGQTSKDDYNNQFNNKYVQQIVIGKKTPVVFTLSGTGISKELSFTQPELWLKGIEKITRSGKEISGISMVRFLNSIDNLNETAFVSFQTAESGGLTLYYDGGRIDHVTGFMLGSSKENTFPLSNLLDPDNKYFLSYDASASKQDDSLAASEDNDQLEVRRIFLSEIDWADQKPADLLALPDRQLLDMNSWLNKKSNSGDKDIFELSKSALPSLNKAEKNTVLLFTARGNGSDFNLEISSEFLFQAQAQEMFLQISLARGNLIIPATAIDLSTISPTLGCDDYRLLFSISELSRQQTENISLPEGYALQGVALNIELYAVADQQKIEINELNDYVYQEFMLAHSVVPFRCTGLRWKDNHTEPEVVPLVFMERNGRIFARTYSNSNSIYAVAVANNTKSFTDIMDHWAQKNVELLAAKQILKGRDKDTFDPDSNVNRAEFAAMLVRGLGVAEPADTKLDFNDISGDEWFAGSVAAATKANIVDSMSDGSFKPQQYVSLQEAAVMMAQALQITGTMNMADSAANDSVLAGFSDYKDIAAWAYPQLATVVQAGIISGNSDGSLMPLKETSRAEAAKMLLSLLRSAALIDERSVVDAENENGEAENRENQEGILVIEGSALTSPHTYSLQELKAMTDIVVRDSYYSRGKEKEGWAAEQHDTFKGISLYELLFKKIGLTSIPTEIKIIADDGYSKILDIEEIASWYIDETQTGKKLEMILAWEQNGKELKQAQPYRLVFGQKYEGDYNRQNWINYVKKIIVD